MLLIIDNYDSFTYNIVHYCQILGADVKVVRNDAIQLSEIRALSPSHLLLSPGPGRPEHAGITLSVVKQFAGHIPLLGVCLGHQAIAMAFGGEITHAHTIKHGKVSTIEHNQQGLFQGLPSPFTATRYHSLVVAQPLPEPLEATAWTSDDKTIMALQHKTKPVWGVQFHPESIASEYGHQLLKHFLDKVI